MSRAKVAIPIVVVVALALAFKLLPPYFADEAAFAEARKKHTVEAYRSYLSTGSRHAAEVRKQWLPEAALAESRAAAEVQKYVENAAAFEGTRYADEVLHDLDALYDKAESAYREKARDADRDRGDWIRGLLEWLRKNRQAAVEITVKDPDTSALAEFDRSRSPAGGVTPVSPSFTPAECAARLDALVGHLQLGLDEIGLKPVVRLKLVDLSAPASDRPRIAIQYVIEPSGTTLSGGGDGAAYAGIRIQLTARLTVPGRAGESVMELDLPPPRYLSVMSRGTRTGGVQLGNVYNAQARDAFARMSQRFCELYLGTRRPATPEN